MLNRVPLADTNGRWAGHDALQTCPLPSFIFSHASLCRIFLIYLLGSLQFSAMNVSVRATMKGAAKCNNHCELQNSVNQLTIERRSALGAFLRACLCQCLHTLCNGFIDVNDCAAGHVLTASIVVVAMLGS